MAVPFGPPPLDSLSDFGVGLVTPVDVGDGTLVTTMVLPGDTLVTTDGLATGFVGSLVVVDDSPPPPPPMFGTLSSVPERYTVQ